MCLLEFFFIKHGIFCQLVKNSYYSNNIRLKCANDLEYRVLASLKVHYFLLSTPTLLAKVFKHN